MGQLSFPFPHVNVKIKGKSERQQAFIWDQKRIAILEAPIQVETQIVFPLGDKGDGHLQEGKVDNYNNRREAFVLVQTN